MRLGAYIHPGEGGQMCYFCRIRFAGQLGARWHGLPLEEGRSLPYHVPLTQQRSV